MSKIKESSRPKCKKFGENKKEECFEPLYKYLWMDMEFSKVWPIKKINTIFNKNVKPFRNQVTSGMCNRRVNDFNTQCVIKNIINMRCKLGSRIGQYDSGLPKLVMYESRHFTILGILKLLLRTEVWKTWNICVLNCLIQ